MATRQMNTVIQQIRRAAFARDRSDMTDGQLLEAFIARKDDETFAALLRRHGPMVMGVCYRVLRNHHDAEDSFQATFLVLARKASSVTPTEQVVNWLHGVAYRTALKARAMRTKTQMRERQVGQMPEPQGVQKDNWTDLQPLLDEELNRLPEIYRLPLLLCDVEGKSIKEATQQLGLPQGTLAGRLVRARKMLAKRLTQRGVVLSGGAVAVVLSEKAASACVSVSLAASTTKAAVAFAAGQTAAPSLVSAKVVALVQGVMKSMMLTKLKTVTMVLLALGMIAFGGSMVPRPTATAQQVISQEGGAEKPASRKADTAKSLDEQKLHGEWIDNEGGKISLTFEPDKTLRLIRPTGRADGSIPHSVIGTYSVDWSKKPPHLDLNMNSPLPGSHLPATPIVQTIIEFIEPGKLRIEAVGGEGVRPKAFTDEALVLTKKEKHPPGSQQAKKDADRDIKAAKFYRRTGKFGTAHFYYQLVQIRYPGTNFAEKAKQGLEDLWKHRTRLPDGTEVWDAPKPPLQPPQPPQPLKPSSSPVLGIGVPPLQSPLPPPPLQPPPPPMHQEAPKTSRDVLEIRQQVKALESRLAALEDKGKPQSPAKTDRDAPAFGQEIHELRQQVKNLESRLAAIEAKGMKTGDSEEPLRVGAIIIVGNTKRDSVYRKAMQLVPGQILDDKAIRTAEKNLAALEATIAVIDTDNPGCKDILVRVKKK
jgi:RNA polymerase sigma factor (sigma-70 family)